MKLTKSFILVAVAVTASSGCAADNGSVQEKEGEVASEMLADVDIDAEVINTDPHIEIDAEVTGDDSLLDAEVIDDNSLLDAEVELDTDLEGVTDDSLIDAEVELDLEGIADGSLLDAEVALDLVADESLLDADVNLDVEIDADAEDSLLDAEVDLDVEMDADTEDSLLDADVELDTDLVVATEDSLLQLDTDLDVLGMEDTEVSVDVLDANSLLDAEVGGTILDEALGTIEDVAEELLAGGTIYGGTCQFDGDCNDGIVCSLDVCLSALGICAHTGVIGCMEDSNPGGDTGTSCSENSDCTDSDGCTRDLCTGPLDLCANVRILGCDDVNTGGDGDGDSMAGDGDGDMMTGDGDGDASGDGDAMTGDGDMMTGDGDGDARGDGDAMTGDGDMMTGDGDGDARGDGDAMAGDGDMMTGDGNDEGDFALAGGACSYDPSKLTTPTWPFLCLVLGLLVLFRRQKWTFSACLGALGLIPQNAHAQGFNADRNPVPHAPEDMLWTERPAIPMDHLSIFGRAMVGYADDPLVERNFDTGEERKVIDSQVSMYLNAGMAFFDLFHVAAMVPFYGQKSASDEESAFDTGGLSLGDPMLAARANILPVGKVLELGVGADLRLPLGSDEAFVADDGVSGAIRTSLGRSFGEKKRSFVALNAAYRFRPSAAVANLDADDELTLGGGLNFAFLGPLAFTAEVHSSTISTRAFEQETTALGALFGLRFAPDNWSVAGGVGPGLSSGFGSPDYRALGAGGVRIGFEEPEEEAPAQKEEREEVPAEVASLPTDPCASETPPDDPAACPELDADGDGIKNAVDLCPREPEDFDQFEDEDGCPDPDNDGDGIPDAVDQCPLDAETKNQIEDEDGCPDKVRVVDGEIVTLEPIFFEYNSEGIQQRSEPLLVEIARVVMDRPEIGAVSIEGHTDAQGSADYNRALSQKRAESVRAFMIDSGVESERLVAQGFGEDRPLSTGTTAADHAKNRRVEFRFATINTEGTAQ